MIIPCENCGVKRNISPIDVAEKRVGPYCRACNAHLHKTVRHQDRTAQTKLKELSAKYALLREMMHP